jgi:outer membrane protein W
MSIIKKTATSIIFLGLFSSTALADYAHPASHETNGKFLAKVRAGYSSMTNNNDYPASNGSLTLKGSYLGEVALGYHFGENMAFEGSLGYNSATLSFDNAGVSTKSTISFIPATALIQYYFVPEATLSPYVGLGYSQQFVTGTTTQNTPSASVESGGGLVGQFGCDVLFDNVIGDTTMGLNFDFKYIYKAKHNLKLQTNSGSSAVTNKMSTATAAIGLTVEF